MKKTKCLSAVLLVLAGVSFVFAGCSDYDADATVDQALIKNADAVNFIKSYTTQELGLDGEWEDYGSVVYTESPYNIESGEYEGDYFEVRVGNKTENDDGTVDFDFEGYYLIKFDGSLLLRYSPDSEEYTVIDDDPDSSAYVSDE